MSRRRLRRFRLRARLRVVPEPATGPRRLPFLLVSFLLVSAMVVGVVTLQALASQAAFRLEELARRNEELQHDHGWLKLRLAELSAPDRINREARRLGLHLPPPETLETLPLKGPLTTEEPELPEAGRVSVNAFVGAGP